MAAWRHAMPTSSRQARPSPHAWGGPLKTLYAAQIGAGLGSTHMVEGVLGSTSGVDASGYRFEDGIPICPIAPDSALRCTRGSCASVPLEFAPPSRWRGPCWIVSQGVV